MMLRTFFAFRHETSLREKRLVSFGGGETPQEPVEAAPAPGPEQLEVRGPILTMKRPEELTEGVQAEVAARKSETNDVVQKQQNAQATHQQNIDAIAKEEGTTPDVLGINEPQSPENIEKMDPELTAEIQKLPQALQSPVMRIISDVNTSEALEAIQSLQGITKLGPQVLDTMLALPVLNENNQLKTNEELNTLKSSKPENALEQAALDFLMQLSDSGRAMMEKIMIVGKDIHEKSKEAPLSPDVAQKIKGYQERWKSATTQEERDITEGFMLLEGAVIDEKGDVTMHTPPTLSDFVMGLFKVITGIFGKLNGGKTAIQKQADELTEPKKEEVPADKLSPEDRAKEITEIEADLKISEETKIKLGNDVKTLKEEMLKATDEAKPGMEERLKGMQKQLAELEAAMAIKAARLGELRGASETSTKDNEKAPEKETLVLFEKEIDNYVVFLLGSRDVKHSMFDINTWYDQLNTEEGKQAAKTIVERANEKLKNAGTKFSIQLENNNLRFEDGIPNNPEEEKLLDTAKTDYLVAEGKAGTNIADDIEYSNQHVAQQHGYIPYLEALLIQVQDSDEWTGDSDSEQAKEAALLQSAAQAVQKNLQVLASALDAAEDKKSPAYENLRKLYCEKSARLTELVASVDEEYENADLRNSHIATQQAEATIARMTVEEATGWVKIMKAQIGENYWQSSGLKETYKQLLSTCESSLEKKLIEEKTAAANNPELTKAYLEHRREISKIFPKPWRRYLT